MRDLITEQVEFMTKSAKCIIVIFIIILSMGTALWPIPSIALEDHECYVAITAREMLQKDNWVIPTCNGELRLQKTPLSYWLVAGLAKITGRVDEITARLPSLILGVLSVGAIIYFVSQWLSFRIAALSACIWATSLGYIRYSVNARPEMALAFFVTLCFLSFYSAITASSRKRQVIYILIFWLSFGLGMLAKGPAPLLYISIPLFCYVAVFRKWKVIPKLLPVIGPVIFLAIVLPWPLLIARKVNWDLTVWKHEFVDRLFGTYRSGDKPIYYYLYVMFQFMTPWFVFLPMALAAPFYKAWDEKRRPMMFLWLWFVADFLFLTLDGGKRQHYILPLMPAIAIVIGILIEDMVFSRKVYTQRYAVGIFVTHIAAIVIFIIAGVIYIARANHEILADIIILGTITLISIAIVCVLFAKRKPSIALGVILASIIVLVDISYIRIFIPTDYNRYSRDFSSKVSQIVPLPNRLVSYKKVSARFVQYFGRVVPEIEDGNELLKHYQNGGWIVAMDNDLKELEKSKSFAEVFYQEKTDRQGLENVPGALFHKPDSLLLLPDKNIR